MQRKIFLACLLISLIPSLAVNAQTITLKGSDTLGDEMVPKLAEAYKKAGKSVNFDIEAEGSSSAFKALASGSAEIGMSSRPIKESEMKSLAASGLQVVEHVAGIDMIAVIVNEKNSTKSIPLAGVKQIFTGQAGTWKQLPGQPVVKAFTRDETSGTFKVFQQIAMDNEDYGKATIKTSGNGEIAEKVAATPGGVGYVGLSYANAPGVRAIPVDEVLPEPANAKTYPLSRNLYYYTIEGKLSPDATDFMTWSMTSPDAAKIIAAVGFIAPN